MGDDPLARWLTELDERVARLAAVLPASLMLDHSQASLRPLESLVRARFGEDAGLVRAAGHADFTMGLAAYLGETLRRAAGGTWGWNHDPSRDLPVVEPPAGVGLRRVSPVHLIMSAVQSADSRQFTEVYQRWSSATPVTPGPAGPDPADPHRAAYPPELVAWLTARERAFPGWSAAYGPADFTPGSLPMLESVLRASAATPAALHEPINRGVREGAAWYLGEVLRRGHGGRWELRDGRPVLGAVDPVAELAAALGEPGRLRRLYDAS